MAQTTPADPHVRSRYERTGRAVYRWVTEVYDSRDAPWWIGAVSARIKAALDAARTSISNAYWTGRRQWQDGRHEQAARTMQQAAQAALELEAQLKRIPTPALAQYMTRDAVTERGEAGGAMAAMLAAFAECEREARSERVRAGIEHARREGRRLGRPATVAHRANEVRQLAAEGLSKAEIARRTSIPRTSVRRLLA